MIRFAPGDIVLLRSFRHSDVRLLSHVRSGRVIFDDARGLMTWTAGGSPLVTMVAEGRAFPRTLAEQTDVRWRLERVPWRPPGILTLTPPDAAHSVWWFFHPDDTFSNWYVNLETPQTRWAGRSSDGIAGGLDTGDNTLDVIGYRTPGGNTWEWKDEGEFAERTGHPWYWDAAGAAAIRAEGDRATAAIEAGTFPFDGSFCDFRPEEAWPIHDDLTGYDRPRAGFESEGPSTAAW